jgi:hypothetical protein
MLSPQAEKLPRYAAADKTELDMTGKNSLYLLGLS